MAPQRDVYNRLARDPYAGIADEDRIYFRDTYDQAVRLVDITESMRDQATSALDTYLSAINNRMNDVMKTLTIITTIFMPLSFVASFFGMNFFGPVASLAAWTDIPAFAATLLLLSITPVAMYLWMRRRRWM
jgi:magnesium transporter